MFRFNKKLFLLCINQRQLSKCVAFDNFFKSSVVKITTRCMSRKTKDDKLSLLFSHVNVEPVEDVTQTGEQLAGKIDKFKLVKTINAFYRHPQLKPLSEDNGLDDYVIQKSFVSFRKYCLETNNLPAELHIVLYDVIYNSRNVIDIFPYFLKFVNEMFPHLAHMEDLKKIGDIRLPANWFQETRKMKRKIIYHSGPTNSGKTYNALKNFLEAKSGVYCGPLKLLAVEIFNKSNEKGTPCDLVTGEEIIHVRPDGDIADHVSCTVEMCSVEKKYEVAVIDEIQMIKDPVRGWAWTRALLGLQADVIHLCGEEAAIDLVDCILFTTNEEIEVKRYERLTSLEIVPSVGSLKNVQAGDCIVCFNKNDIFNVIQGLENLAIEVAVIYGSLPPRTKLAQCKKFNDPDNSCNVLVATDAIGMGLNLSIKRIIFYSMRKTTTNEKGDREVAPISVSQALQIAGRAGRYGTKYSEGYVTTFRTADLPLLNTLLSSTPEAVVKAGLLPTVDQIELYSYYMPHLKFSSLIEIFIRLSTVDDSIYFMCDLKDFIFLAESIEHINLPLRVKYTFCCAPINKKSQFLCLTFVKFAKIFSENNIITFNWLCKHIGYPFEIPKNIRELEHLEAVHDVLDLYLWLSNRFPDYFCEGEHVKAIQKELDETIQAGVISMAKLLLGIDSLSVEKKLPERKSNEELEKLINNLQVEPSEKTADEIEKK